MNNYGRSFSFSLYEKQLNRTLNSSLIWSFYGISVTKENFKPNKFLWMLHCHRELSIELMICRFCVSTMPLGVDNFKICQNYNLATNKDSFIWQCVTLKPYTGAMNEISHFIWHLHNSLFIYCNNTRNKHRPNDMTHIFIVLVCPRVCVFVTIALG